MRKFLLFWGIGVLGCLCIAKAQTITVGAVSGTITACLHSVSSSPNIQQFTVTGTGLTSDITASAPIDFEISLSPNSGYSTMLTLPKTNGTVSRTIYVRASVTAKLNGIAGRVMLTSSPATPKSADVAGTVNDVPYVFGVNNQTKNNGEKTDPIKFEGKSPLYRWTNDNPAIGLPASGTGDIPSFTATNTSNQLIGAHITVTPEPSGYIYVAITDDNSVAVINSGTNKIYKTLKVGKRPVRTIVSPDGRHVYTCNQQDNSVTVIDAGTNEVVTTIGVGNGPTNMAITSDGTKLFTCDAGSRTVSVINTADNKVITTIQIGTESGFPIFNNDETRLYVTGLSNDIGVVVINTNNYKVEAKIASSHYTEGLVLNADGSRLFVAGDNVKVINTATNLIIKSIAAGPDTYIYGYNGRHTGKYLYVANTGKNTVRAINTSTYEVEAIIPVGEYCMPLSESPDGKYVYAFGVLDKTISVISTATNSVVSTIKVNCQLGELIVSPDGSRLYLTDLGNKIHVINTATNTLIGDIPTKAMTYFFENSISKGDGCSGTPTSFSIAVNAATPVITPTGAPSAVNTTYGTPSPSGSFVISGSDLSQGITITPPPGFEVSTDQKNYSPTITVAKNADKMPIYIRLAAVTNAGSYSGNIVLTSQGAPDVKVLMPNSVVKPAVINTFGNLNKTYGDALTDFTVYNNSTVYKFNVTGLKNGNTGKSIQVSLSAGNGPAASVGVYKKAVTLSDFEGDNGYLAGNYIVNYAQFDLVVLPAPLTITAYPESKMVGGMIGNVPESIEFTAVGLKNNEYIGSVRMTFGTGNEVSAPPGVYPGSVKISDAKGGTFNPANYTITYKPADLTVTGAAPVITFANAPSPVSTTYGTPSASTSFNVTGTDLTGDVLITPPAGFEVSLDDINYNSTVTLPADKANNTPVYTRLAATTNAGTYSGNFTLKSAGAADVKVPIDISTVYPAEIDITGAATKVYGEVLAGQTLYYNTPGFTYPDPGLKNGNTFYSIRFDFNDGAAADAAVGTYSGSVVVSEFKGTNGYLAGNYTLVYKPGDMTVIPAPLTITAKSVNKPYGATLTNIAASTDFTVDGLQNGETIGTVDVAYGSGAAATDPAGLYSGSVSISGATGGTFNPANYDITYVKADITVSAATPAIITADAPLPVNTIYGTPSGAGSFTISGSTLSTGITVTPPAGFEVSTDNINFGNTVIVGTGGTVNATVVYIRLAGTTDTGPYSGNITLTSGPTQTTVFMPVSTVSPAPLTVAGISVSKTYGTALQNYTGPDKFTITAGSLKNGNTISAVSINYGTGADAGSHAGKYSGSVMPGAITGDNGFKASNYTITYANADITVVPATLTITAANQTRDYGTDNPTLTFTYSGFVNGDTEAQLTTRPTASTAATISSAPGRYAIIVGGGASPDYTFTYNNGVLTINPLPDAVLVVPNTFTPNGDGINDTWNLPALASYPNCTVNIYDRYGQMVFHSIGYSTPWDGRQASKNVPTGVYYYIIDKKNNTGPVSGSLTVLR